MSSLIVTGYIPTSSSFSKGDTSLTSPSSTTEGAVSPSIEDKSKSELVLDPCTLAQGFEELTQKGLKVKTEAQLTTKVDEITAKEGMLSNIEMYTWINEISSEF